MGVTLDDFFCGFQQRHKTDSIAACSLAQAMMLPSLLCLRPYVPIETVNVSLSNLLEASHQIYYL